MRRIDTANWIEYHKNRGILHYVLRNLMKAACPLNPFDAASFFSG